MGSVSGSIFLFLDYTEVVLHHSLRLKLSLVYLMLGFGADSHKQSKAFLSPLLFKPTFN